MQPKRFLIPLLVVILVTFTAISVAAAPAATNSLGIAVDATSDAAIFGEDGLVTVKPLDVVDISVTAGTWTESQIGQITVKFVYDSSMVELVSANNGVLYADVNVGIIDYRANEITFSFIGGYTGYGELLNLSFKVKDGVHTESVVKLAEVSAHTSTGWNEVSIALSGDSEMTFSCHKYSDGTVTSPTCIAQGYTTYTCTECGKSVKGNYTNTVDHEGGAAATCTADQVCKYGCGTVVTPKLGHDVAETCATVVCPRCNESVAGTLEHTYGDWTIEKEATRKEDGSKYKTCSRCSEKVTEVIPFEGGSLWWLIVLIVVVVLGGGFCCYWFLFRKKNENQTQKA